MAIEFVGAAHAENGVAPVPLTMPTTVKDDFAILCLSRSITVGLPTPSGWTLLDSSNGNSSTTYVFTKFMEPSDSGATLSLHLDVADTQAANAVATCSVYRNVDATTPIEAWDKAIIGGATTIDHPSPTITVITDGAWIVDNIMDKVATDTNTYAAPSGRTQRAAEYANNGLVQALFDGNTGFPPGATTPVTYTAGGGAKPAQSIVYSFALKPGVVVPPAPTHSRYQLQSGQLAAIQGYRLASGVLS